MFTVKITLDFEYSYVNHLNLVTILHNGEQKWHNRLKQKQIIIFADVDTGSQTLEVCLSDKTDADTIVDENNAIVEDSFIVLKNIEIDGYMMRSVINSAMSQKIDWTQNTGAYEYIKAQGKDPDTELEHSNMLSLNGSLIFNYQYPVAEWLLQQRNDQDQYMFNTLMKEEPELLQEVKSLLDMEEPCAR